MQIDNIRHLLKQALSQGPRGTQFDQFCHPQSYRAKQLEPGVGLCICLCEVEEEEEEEEEEKRRVKCRGETNGEERWRDWRQKKGEENR